MLPTITAKDMVLRDCVRMKRMEDEVFPWSTCAVVKIDKDKVTLKRPYGHTEEWSHGGKDHRAVIFMIGMEEYSIELTSHVEYELIERPGEPR